MADTTKITYVSLENLGYYDDKLKAYIKTKDDALQLNIDGANAAVEAEATRAKAAELTNAQAAQAAQDAADAVAAKVGEVPESSTVMDIITNIQENAYDDTEIRGLISDLDENKADKTQVATDIADAVKVETDARVEAINALSGTVEANKTAIEGTVSTLEQKVNDNEADIEGKVSALTERVAANETAVGTTLPNAINEEKAAREAADNAINERLVEVETFFKTAEGETLDEALDTLVELQTYLNGEGAVADQMLLDIAANKKAIEDHVATDHDFAAADAALKAELNTEIAKKADATTVSDMDAAYKAADTQLSNRLDTLEAIDHDAYVAADTALKTELEGKINAKADQTALDKEIQDRQDADDALKTEIEAAYKKYADEEDAKIESRVEALETASATHALASDVEALAGRMTTAEGEIDQIKSDLDVVEALAAANENAIKANQSAIALCATTEALNTEIARATAAEEDLQEQIDAFEECTTADIDGLFAE